MRPAKTLAITVFAVPGQGSRCGRDDVRVLTPPARAPCVPAGEVEAGLRLGNPEVYAVGLCMGKSRQECTAHARISRTKMLVTIQGNFCEPQHSTEGR